MKGYRRCAGLTLGHAVLLTAFLTALAWSPAAARMLEARVEHSESLTPVEDDLRPGATFRPGMFASRAVERNRWYQIPAWLAGTWRQDTSTMNQHYDFETGIKTSKPEKKRDIVERTFGDQVDSKGRIWAIDRCPFEVTGAYENRKICAIFQSYDLIDSTADSLTIKSLQVSVTIDPFTEKILLTTTKESISSVHKAGKDKCRTKASVKVFDLNGKPLDLYESESERRRVAPFHTVSEIDGHALAPLLKQFMETGK